MLEGAPTGASSCNDGDRFSSRHSVASEILIPVVIWWLGVKLEPISYKYSPDEHISNMDFATTHSSWMVRHGVPLSSVVRHLLVSIDHP
jgi:hypothetical protein